MAPISEEFARHVLASQPFAVLTGTELVSFEPGRAELRLPIKPEFTQRHGFAHGGLVGYAADNAIAFAGGSLLGDDTVTSEYKINYLRPALGDHLVAKAQAISTGRRQIVCRCDVFVVAGSDTKLCAAAIGTVTTVEKKE